MKKQIPRPRCQGQPCYVENTQAEPMMVGQLELKKGERACLGGRQPHKFLRREVRGTVPSWCPRLRNMPRWRLYDLTEEYRPVYEAHYKGVKALDQPMEGWYTLIQEDHMELSARDFWWEVTEEHMSVKLLLGVLLEPGQLLVIDDGVEPRAFYQTATKLIQAAYRPEALPSEAPQ